MPLRGRGRRDLCGQGDDAKLVCHGEAEVQNRTALPHAARNTDRGVASDPQVKQRINEVPQLDVAVRCDCPLRAEVDKSAWGVPLEPPLEGEPDHKWARFKASDVC